MSFFDLFRQPDIHEGLHEYDAQPDAVLVDVRTEEEFRQGHIPCSRNVPLHSIDQISLVAENKDVPLYVYCQSGTRSRRAAGMLMQMGYHQVKNLGGISAYKGKVAR